MRQHGALGPPCGAGSVEDGRQIVAPALHGREIGRQRLCLFDQRAVLRAAQRQHMRRAGLHSAVTDPILGAGPADRDAGLGIGQEILDLSLPVGGVQRQIGGADAQAGEIEEDGLGRLVHLHGDAVAGRHAQCDQQVGDPAAPALQIRVAVALAVASLDEQFRAVGGKTAFEQLVEIIAHGGIHPVGSFIDSDGL